MKILHAYNIGLLVYIPIFVFLLLLFIFFYDDKGRAQGEWVETKATIIDSSRYSQDGEVGVFKYSYDVDGERYFGELRLSQVAKQVTVLQSYYGKKRHGQISVFYDSENPSVSKHSIVNLETNWGLLILVFVCAIGSFYLLKRSLAT